MNINKNNKYLIWLDLEMTGLCPEVDKILELAILITDKELNIIDDFGPIAIRQPGLQFTDMNLWCQKTHKKTGLWDRVVNSNYDIHDVENNSLSFVSKWTEHGTAPVCGNTVFHDRKFLNKYMPKLDDFFHYRCIDVSTIKELIKLWNPSIMQQWKKPHPHQAMDDIRYSVEELRVYKEHFLKCCQ